MSRKTIACCIICKNEEALIARALDSVKWVDAIYILDTGSQDSTIEICRRYTDNVFLDSIWTDNFSFHQNEIKSRAKEDVIISLDSDEVLLSTEEEVRAAVEKMNDVARVTMVAEGPNPNTFYFGRIFRNCPEIFWQAAIHKHLNVPGEGEDVGEVKIMYGHSPAHELDPDRSLRMLEHTVSVEKNPVRNLYYLGREYYYKERYQDAVDTFQRYIKVAHWRAELAEAYFVMAQCYEKLKMVEEMGAATLQAIKTNPEFKEAIDYMELISIDENKAQWRRMSRTANNSGVLWVRTKAEPLRIIAIFSHNDDECMWFCYSLIRVAPLVVICTDSHIQDERGEVGCSAEERRNETIAAMKLLGCTVVFLGIKDTELTEDVLREKLGNLNADKYYIPAYHENGNHQHNLVNKVCLDIFKNVRQYTSYSKDNLFIEGNEEIFPTESEIALKNKALDCYKSQINLPSMKSHFEYIRNKSEWLL